MSGIKITNNTAASTDKRVFLIYIDGISYGYSKSIINARYHMEDLADALEKELTEENTRVLRQNINENEVHISRQRLGTLYDGKVKLKHRLFVKEVSNYYRPNKNKTD